MSRSSLAVAGVRAETGGMDARRRAGAGAATVLCVGQATLDHVLTVPGELVTGHKHVAQRHDVIGGGLAANAAVAVARLGGVAALAGVIGDDENGTRVLDGLRAEGVDVRRVQQATGLTTPWSAVIVSAGGARTIVNHSPDELLAHPRPDLDDVDCDAVLVDGRWAAGSAAALSLARRRGIPGVVDVDRATVDAAAMTTCLVLASHLVVSEDALLSLTGAAAPADGLRRISQDTDAHVSVTLGSHGVVWLDGGDVRSLAAFEVEAVDTTGAGDVFHGATALALAEGADETAAFRFAAAAAALKCTRPGARAGIPTRGEVEELLDRRSISERVSAP